jgi:hypothetical protein
VSEIEETMEEAIFGQILAMNIIKLLSKQTKVSPQFRNSTVQRFESMINERNTLLKRSQQNCGKSMTKRKV